MASHHPAKFGGQRQQQQRYVFSGMISGGSEWEIFTRTSSKCWSSQRSIMHFLLYINDFPDDAICNIAIYANDTTLYCKCDQAPDLWKQLELAAELETDL